MNTLLYQFIPLIKNILFLLIIGTTSQTVYWCRNSNYRSSWWYNLQIFILFWRIRTLHHFKNHLISQELILSIFMESLFVQWRIYAKLIMLPFQCHCKLEWQQYFQFALIPADLCLDICLGHTFTTNYCLSIIYNNICNS